MECLHEADKFIDAFNLNEPGIPYRSMAIKRFVLKGDRYLGIKKKTISNPTFFYNDMGESSVYLVEVESMNLLCSRGNSIFVILHDIGNISNNCDCGPYNKSLLKRSFPSIIFLVNFLNFQKEDIKTCLLKGKELYLHSHIFG